MPGMGPLPKPDDQRRRTNAPTIPTTNLPAGGFAGPVPDPPAWVDIGDAGLEWWTWAWATPQAAAWSDGDLTVIARRASLEDDLRVMNAVDEFDIDDGLATISGDESKYRAEISALKKLVKRLAAISSGRMAVCREARELDNLLGLTPKGMAALRWRIVGEPKAVECKPAAVARLDDRRKRVADGA